MYVWIGGALVVLITGMVGYAFQHPRIVEAPVIEYKNSVSYEATSSPTNEYADKVKQEFTLGIGESLETKAGWLITPIAVVEDSRCPVDVQCIQAGTVRVKVHLVTHDFDGDQILTLGKNHLVFWEDLTLIAVTPTPLSTTNPTVKDYRFTFSVVSAL